MATYERLDEQGQVLETVYAADGTFEDTRLGVAVLEGVGGWRVQPDPTPDPAPAAAEPAKGSKPKAARGESS